MLVVRGFIKLEWIVITGVGCVFGSAIEAVGGCRALRWMMGTVWRRRSKAPLKPAPRNTVGIEQIAYVLAVE